jgi:CubicO group peptidase (beta-lactamase class C family)
MNRRSFLTSATAGAMLSAGSRWAQVAFAAPQSNSTAAAAAPAKASANLRDNLETIRAKLALPAIGGMVVSSDATLASAATGFCKLGENVRITDDAHWQIGSITKTFTATLAAMLVDRGKLTWETTLASIYPQHVSIMAPNVGGITIRQLVTHRSGMERGDAFPWEGTPELNAPGLTLSQRRQRGAVLAMKGPLEFTPGTKNSYSNRGYNTLGAALEKVAGESWEDLIVQEIAKPLGMKSPMFGEPALTGPREPWPHVQEGNKLKPVPPVPRDSYGYYICNCAGGITLTLADFGRWIQAHLKDEVSGGILSRQMFKIIHTAVEDGGVPAFGIEHHPVFGRTLIHNGSNTRNYALHAIFPEHNFGVMLGVNAVPPDNVPADFYIYNTLLATASPDQWPQPSLHPPRPNTDDVLEGEALELVRFTGGNVDFQQFRQLSNQFQLWWNGAKEGDKLLLRLDVPQAGNYTLDGNFATNNDYGEVTFELGPIKRRLNFHTDKLAWTQLPIGNAALQAGPQLLTLTAHGSTFCQLGLDTLRLRPT